VSDIKTVKSHSQNTRLVLTFTIWSSLYFNIIVSDDKENEKNEERKRKKKKGYA